jgi:UTP--glucose-1-phosphate uridylyltransferase
VPAELERSQKSASHAHPVRKAVIPVAGLGTRLFPATRAVKKEFFPIIDRDGLAKPAILLIVNEALEAGIEKVILVVQGTDLDDFQAFFGSEPAPELWDGLPASQKHEMRRILEASQHLSFAVQSTQDGFGHAVYSARAAVGDEPFLLMLGDHLYHSNNDESCADQLLAAYEQHGRNVLGLRRIREEDLARCGVVSGHWLQKDQILEITQFVEKPTADLAKASLRVAGLPDGEYLAVFGQYVLQPGVFDHLGAQISGEYRERGEFQLTSALEHLRAKEGFLGLVIDGQAYDIGTPASYLHTIGRFAAGN